MIRLNPTPIFILFFLCLYMLLSFQILVDIAQVVLPFLLKKWVYVYFEFDPQNWTYLN